MQKSASTDTAVCNILLHIIEQEVEHEEDLQALLEDLELMVRHKSLNILRNYRKQNYERDEDHRCCSVGTVGNRRP